MMHTSAYLTEEEKTVIANALRKVTAAHTGVVVAERRQRRFGSADRRR